MTTSRHHGYYHYATLCGTMGMGCILPMREPWVSDTAGARDQAQRIANEYGWPIIVFWCHLLDGRLTREYTVRPAVDKERKLAA